MLPTRGTSKIVGPSFSPAEVERRLKGMERRQEIKPEISGGMKTIQVRAVFRPPEGYTNLLVKPSIWNCSPLPVLLVPFYFMFYFIMFNMCYF